MFLDPNRVPGFQPVPLEHPVKATARALFRWAALIVLVAIVTAMMAYMVFWFPGFAEGPRPQ
jgi:hypothetical protein